MRRFRQLPLPSEVREKMMECPCCGASPSKIRGASRNYALLSFLKVFNAIMLILVAINLEGLHVVAQRIASNAFLSVESIGVGIPIAIWAVGDIIFSLVIIFFR
ncbi:hypothetical protein [Ruegeria arenilitoris]|uniref:hypothetical protein n=1 Tax=Ruegeria arenilitoris TaxID=1173585 RepID=UPI00147E112D|nr:hypothetical protein [Ruegeria arenilitoris]